MRAAEIRERFLSFFRERGHELVPSSPVVPHDDPTLLFANAGMNQFKGVFTGRERREIPRAASSQKCIRAGGKHNDLENVGYTARHLTFFEMLGNFSFGDYFKEDACRWAWELVTGGFGLDPARLWVTVFHEDDEARAIWRDVLGVDADRIIGCGAKDNFWSMGDVGPCGPCSEIHFDLQPEAGGGFDDESGDRFLEIWNLVFMQYEQRASGERVALPRPSIDTGMGLERIALVLQDVDSVFRTDLLAGLAQEVAELTGRPVAEGVEGTPHRVLADHVRSLAFAIADGAFPSNEGRGYVLRRILRRAARYGYKLGVEEPFIFRLIPRLVRDMGAAYPELAERQELVERLIRSEEESFGLTLRKGMQSFDAEVGRMRAAGTTVFPGEQAFFLHDTCGFPIDLTEQMAREQELAVDRPRFDELMEEQRDRSRGEGRGAESDAGGGPALDGHPPTTFTGYRELTGEGRLLACEDEGDELLIVLDRTPFYGEGGGQIGDTGSMEGEGLRLRVTDTQKTAAGVHVHHAHLEVGSRSALVPGVTLRLAVDAARRLAIQRNHTATHLLHAALREVLGTHVQQKGSLVEPERLRFDLSHFERIDDEQLERVEARVSEVILRDTAVEISERSREEAIAAGAMAFFGEKYGDVVRVVEVPGYSTELCGGAHVERTGEIGPFTIVSEGSVSSGVRRVEAITGEAARRRNREGEALLAELSGLLKVGRSELPARLAGLLDELRELRSGAKKGGGGGGRDLAAELAARGERSEVGGCEILCGAFEGVAMDEILTLADSLKRRPGERFYILATHGTEGVRFVVGHSQEVARGRAHCGDIARGGAQILGGGGGGRPDLAQAGGRDGGRLTEALAHMREEIVRALS